MSKQTAVEWLFEMLNNPKNDQVFAKKLLDKAKEIEKQQHSKTWDAALDKYEVRAGNYMRAYEDFDDYYKTYTSNIN